MPKVYVKKDFFFNDGEEVKHYEVGYHEMDEATIDHWFVQAHIGDAALMQENKARTAELEQQSIEKDARIAELEQQIAALTAENTPNADKPKSSNGK
jgi:hypothetical protein